MNNYKISRQTLVILLLGFIAIIAELGTFILLFYQTGIDIGVVTALIAFTSSITGGFIGFLTGKETQPNNNIGERES